MDKVKATFVCHNLMPVPWDEDARAVYMSAANVRSPEEGPEHSEVGSGNLNFIFPNGSLADMIFKPGNLYTFTIEPHE